ncbi:hypothetical protein JXA40_10900 [bacterium]|nr:hypothetical protein [candidate division CSSED10-310 bacterium]
MKRCRLDRNCGFAPLIWAGVLLLVIPCQLHGSRIESPSHHRWFPLVLPDHAGNTVILSEGAEVEAEIPGSSAILIRSRDLTTYLEVFSVYCMGTSDDYAKTLVPARLIRVDDHTVVIPTGPGRGYTFLIRAVDRPARLSLYRQVRYSRDTYWRDFTAGILREIDVADLEGGAASHAVLTHQLQQLRQDAVETVPVFADFEPLLRRICHEILLSRRLLAREDSLTRSLELDGESGGRGDPAGDLIRTGTDLKVKGPSILKLIVRPGGSVSNAVRNRDEVLGIFIDGMILPELRITAGSAPGSSRWLRNTIPARLAVSDRQSGEREIDTADMPVTEIYYIPIGDHTIRLDPDAPVRIQAEISRLEHLRTEWISETAPLTPDALHPLPYENTVLDLVTFGIHRLPRKLKTSLIWLERQSMVDSDDPVINAFYRSQRRKLEWRGIEASGDRGYFLDPPSVLSTLKPARSEPHAVPGFCVIHPGQTVSLEIEIIDECPYFPVPIYDLDSGPGDLPLVIDVDGRKRILERIPGIPDPAADLFLTPGVHTLRIHEGNRDLYIDHPAADAESVPGYIREYLYVDKTVHFACNGGDFGQTVRILYRPRHGIDGEIPLEWRFSGSEPVRVICRPAGKSGFEMAGFYMDVPPGLSEVIVRSGEAGWFHISCSDFPDVSIEPFDIRKVETEQISRFFESPPDVPDLCAGLVSGRTKGIDRVLGLAYQGDIRNAVSAYLALGMEPGSIAADLLECYLLSRTGHYYDVLEKGERISNRTGYCERWFLIAMSQAAIRTGKPLDVLNWTDRVLSRYPDDPQAGILRARTLAHLGDFNGVADLIAPMLERTDVGIEERFWMDYLRRIDPAGTGLGEDWAVLSPSPQFEAIDIERFNPDAGWISMIDELKLDRESGVDPESGVNRMVMRSGDEMYFEMTGPTVLRISIRPDHPLDGASGPAPFVFQYRDGSLNTRICFQDNKPDRDGVSYRGDTHVRPGTAETVDIPIPEGTRRIEICGVSGSATLRFFRQVPGIDDLPGSGEGGMTGEQVRGIIRDLYASDSGSVKMLAAAARIEALRKAHPESGLLKRMHEDLRHRYQWRILPSIDTGAQTVTLVPGRMSHHPLVQVRGCLIEDPVKGIPAELIVPGTSIRYRLPAGINRFRIYRANPAECSNGIRLMVFYQNRLIGEMKPQDRMIEIEQSAPFSDLLSVSTASGCYAEPMKVTVMSVDESGNEDPVPVMSRETYCESSIGHPAMTGIFGPGLLRLTCRELSRRIPADPVEIMVQVASNSQPEAWHETVFMQSVWDETIKLETGGDFVGEALEMTIPLMNQDYYTVTVHPVRKQTSTVLVRFAGAVPSVDPSRVELAPGSVALTGQPGKIPLFGEDAKTSEPFQVWSSKVPDGLPLRGQDGGTWTFDGVYRHREEAGDSNDLWEPYSSSGLTAEFGYQRRFEGRGLYLDAGAGAASPNENDRDSVQWIRQRLDAVTDLWDLRGSLTARGYLGEVRAESEYSIYVTGDFRRTFRPGIKWYVIPAAGFHYRHMSLDAGELDGYEEAADPRLFNDFDCRHRSGASFESTVRFDPLKSLMMFAQFQTMTAGDGDSGLFGPWWFETGIKGVTGPVLWSAEYSHRSSFGSSVEPERSRLTGKISVFRWAAGRWYGELGISDRYTLETRWNDFRVSLGIRFSSGRLLRDMNPYRLVFKPEIEKRAFDL